jgi:hypothetical protein
MKQVKNNVHVCVHWHKAHMQPNGQYLDKRKIAGKSLGRVFIFSQGRSFAPCTSFSLDKLSNLKWKTRPKQLLGYLPLAFMYPGEF